MFVNTIQGPLWLILQPPLAAIQLGFFPCPFTFMPKEFWQKESLV